MSPALNPRISPQGIQTTRSPRGVQQGKTDSLVVASAIDHDGSEYYKQRQPRFCDGEPNQLFQPNLHDVLLWALPLVSLKQLLTLQGLRRVCVRRKERIVDTQSPTNDLVLAPLDFTQRACTYSVFDGLDPTSVPCRPQSKRGGRASGSERGSAPVKIPSILQRTEAQRNEASQTVPLVQRSAEVTPAPLTLGPHLRENFRLLLLSVAVTLHLGKEVTRWFENFLQADKVLYD